MNAYWVTGTVIGLHTVQHKIKAPTAGDATDIFEAKYPRRQVVIVECKRADIEVTRSMRVPA